jgi:arylsulfatase
MEADRTELHDLAADRPELVQKLEAKWNAYAERAMVLPLGAWRGRSKPEKLNKKQRQFQLKAGDDLGRSEAPFVEGRALTITVVVRKTASDGVLVAQGGSAHGYSLYVQKGKLCFATRHDGHLFEIITAAGLPPAEATVMASLGKSGKIVLTLNGNEIGQGKAPGPLVSMPADGLQVGQDLKGAVGDYKAPFPFQGQIDSVKVVLQP